MVIFLIKYIYVLFKIFLEWCNKLSHPKTVLFTNNLKLILYLKKQKKQ